MTGWSGAGKPNSPDHLDHTKESYYEELGPCLARCGGPTFTQALLPGSPAIDQGYSFGLTADQRGFPRTVDRPCIANAPGGDGTDIGAFEVPQPCPVPLPLVNVGVVSSQFVFDLAGSSIKWSSWKLLPIS